MWAHVLVHACLTNNRNRCFCFKILRTWMGGLYGSKVNIQRTLHCHHSHLYSFLKANMMVNLQIFV